MPLFSYGREFDPMDTLVRLQRGLDNVFQNPGFDLGVSGRGVYPPMNVFRDDAGLAIRLEVPGFSPEDLTVESRGQTLVVAGKPEANETTGSFHRRERVTREFSRSLSLPRDVDPSRASAACKNGILSIHVPLREEAKPREIAVQSS